MSAVLLCVSHLEEQIMEFAGDGSAWGLKVTYVHDGPVRLGTGGAIRGAIDRLEESFFVIYGDSYLPLDYRDLMARHLDSEQAVTMAVYRNEDRWDRSNVIVEGDRVTVYSKDDKRPGMAWIEAGVTVYRRDTIAGLPGGVPSDLASLCRDLAAAGHVGAYVSPVRFWEIGSRHGLAAFRGHTRRALRTSKSAG